MCTKGEKKPTKLQINNQTSEEIINTLKSTCFWQPRLEFLREIKLWDEKYLLNTSHSALTITPACLSSPIPFFF